MSEWGSGGFANKAEHAFGCVHAGIQAIDQRNADKALAGGAESHAGSAHNLQLVLRV